MFRIFIVFACFLTAVGAAPTSNAQSLALTTLPFNEKEREAARISGHLVTGVQHSSAPDETVLLQAYIPEGWAGKTVCSRVISVDGLYEASNEYLVDTEWTGGMADIPHPTTKPHMLRDRQFDAISVRVSPSLCDIDAEEVTLAAWSGVRQAPALLVNSFQAEAVFVYFADNPVPVRCVQVNLEGRSAYDTRCPLDGVAAKGRNEIDLLRIVDGKPAPQSKLFIWLP